MSATVIRLPAREGGTSNLSRRKARQQRQQYLDAVVLALVHQNGGRVAYHDLLQVLPCTRSELFASIGRQYTLGNLRRSLPDEPVELTASARIAIMAGEKFSGSQTAANAETVEKMSW